jgi:hypothetical protein
MCSSFNLSKAKTFQGNFIPTAPHVIINEQAAAFLFGRNASALGGVFVRIIAMVVVSYQAVRAAMINPVESLKEE